MTNTTERLTAAEAVIANSAEKGDRTLVASNGTIYFNSDDTEFRPCTHGEEQCEHKKSSVPAYTPWDELDESIKKVTMDRFSELIPAADE